MWNTILSMWFNIGALRTSILTMWFYILPMLATKQIAKSTAKEKAHLQSAPPAPKPKTAKELFLPLFPLRQKRINFPPLLLHICNSLNKKALHIITRVSLRAEHEQWNSCWTEALGALFRSYGFIVKLLEDISREQDVLFFLGIRFWRTLSVLSCFPSRWDIISLTQKSIF